MFCDQGKLKPERTFSVACDASFVAPCANVDQPLKEKHHSAE